MVELTEHFIGYQKHGTPLLRGRKYRSTMAVEWGQGLVWEYHTFAAALDQAAMDAALMEVWQRYKSQCDVRAIFHHGGVNGCMVYVPIDAGLEAMAVIRKHFIKALSLLPSERERA